MDLAEYLDVMQTENPTRYPTLASLAREIGYTPQHLSVVKRGLSAPGRELAMALERVTNGRVTAIDMLQAWIDAKSNKHKKTRNPTIETTGKQEQCTKNANSP